jgi:hypothetical protein
LVSTESGIARLADVVELRRQPELFQRGALVPELGHEADAELGDAANALAQRRLALLLRLLRLLQDGVRPLVLLRVNYLGPEVEASARYRSVLGPCSRL